jgi:hypothetical protein
MRTRQPASDSQQTTGSLDNGCFFVFIFHFSPHFFVLLSHLHLSVCISGYCCCCCYSGCSGPGFIGLVFLLFQLPRLSKFSEMTRNDTCATGTSAAPRLMTPSLDFACRRGPNRQVQPQSLGTWRLFQCRQRGPSQGPIDCFDMYSDVTKRVVEVKGHHTLAIVACDVRFE